MCTYFATGAKLYRPVTVDDDVETEPFLDACLGIVEFIGFFGTAFIPVKNDVDNNVQFDSNNIWYGSNPDIYFTHTSHSINNQTLTRTARDFQKIRNKYKTNPNEYRTIKKLIAKEIAHQKSQGHNNMGSATEALLWLKRGLEYFLNMMELIIEDHKSGKKSESLVPLCKTAYENKLKRHHNFFSKSLFHMAVHATPWRKDLMKLLALGKDDMENQVVDDLTKYIETMKTNVDCICKFYLDEKLETLPEIDKM